MSLENIPDKDQNKKEIVSDLIGFDIGKLIRTCKDLTHVPGPTIDTYIRGERSLHLSPINYYVLIFGVSFLIESLLGIGEYAVSRIMVAPGPDQDLTRLNSILEAFFQRKEIQLLFILPGTILFQWLLFRKFRPSFIQNVFFALFAGAQYLLLTLPLVLLFLVSKEVHYQVTLVSSFILPVLFNTYAAIGFYGVGWKGLLWRSALVYLLNMPLVTIITALMVATANWLYG